ncbi:DUF4230 domain-containing protein [Corynebacterium pseudopelargi]|uniref:DUF4230 domain-containing protein n=1 Tax=Corynebacterium pseudopelargi TaxID=2080757 RepID=A0A3G6IW40_9CORY|nr:DUF4230 domain-containing protein [Corynebacterium pseudopelargi]AZA09999.1 hypothetical protein CPPEL_09480 [Corynebacterium pseudopelargi]
MKNAAKIAVALIIGAVVAVAGFIGLNKAGIIGDPNRTITSTGIGGQLEDISELAVEQYTYSNVGRFEEDGLKALGIRIPLTGKNFLVAYDGVVKAGLKNFDKVDVDINDAERTITVKAPKVQILSSEIEPSSVVVYDQSFNPLNQLKVDDLTEFLDTQEKEAEKKAKKEHLLDRASQRVKTLMKSQTEAFIEGSDKQDYAVKVETK